jgi:hypothetical protein
MRRMHVSTKRGKDQRGERSHAPFRKIDEVISTDMTMKTQIQQRKRAVARAPTLQTVLMVEKFIDDNSGEFKKTELRRRLPRRVMWQTFQVIMSYLEGTNRIVYDREGYVAYVWNPKLVAKYKDRPAVRILREAV